VKRLAFFLNIEPQPPTVTHQEKKVRVVKGKPFYYDPPELKNARALLTVKLAKFRPPEPWDCPIMLCAEWSFRRPKGVKGVFKTTKPDTDNLQKMLKDVMTACGYWRDDALVCREVVSKIWHDEDEKHGILISITELPENGEN